jgi:hypothetical protein
MQCTGSEKCPARLFPDIPCWEIARIVGSVQECKQVCSDCIVYIIKANSPLLTEDELEKMIEYRDVMKFVGKCPAYETRIRTDREILF